MKLKQLFTNIAFLFRISNSRIAKLAIFYFFYRLYSLFKFKLSDKIEKKKLIQNIINNPLIAGLVRNKLIKSTKILEKDLCNSYKNLEAIPDKGYDKTKLDTQILVMPKSEQKKNQISGIIYHGGDIHKNRLVEIFKKYALSNPLHPDVFPEIREMEVDIINMTRQLFKGDKSCSGNITLGGTESILLACVTYRDYYRQIKNITKPNIVGLESIHPAFDKAGHYFGIEIRKVKVNINTGTSQLDDVQKLIDENTILLVGSAPSYAHGIIDPIVSMANLAQKKDISFHLDCCMGGFLIPFLDNYKHINFNIKGITSISLDTHKYGNSLKGSSVILYRDYNIKKFQHFINKDWNGGIYCTPTMMGSKSGGLIAAAWASMLYMGNDEYSKIANMIKNNVTNIRYKIGKNTNIKIIGKPNINIIAFRSNILNIYSIAGELKKKGWNISIMQNPASFHLCLTNLHTREVCDKFCDDLNQSIDTVLKSANKKLSGTLALYGSSQEVGTSLFIEEVIHDFIFLLSRKSISERY